MCGRGVIGHRLPVQRTHSTFLNAVACPRHKKEMYFVFTLADDYRSVWADDDIWPFAGNRLAAPGSFTFGRPTLPDLKPRSTPAAPLFAAALAALSTALKAGDFFPLV